MVRTISNVEECCSTTRQHFSTSSPAEERYRRSIPVLVCVSLSLFKLSHGASLLHVSEAFAVDKTTVCYVLREFILAVNLELRSKISWPRGGRIFENIREFKDLCGLLDVVGAIDGTHFAIRKLESLLEDYFYYKSGGYSIQAEAVVNRHKRFLDVIMVGMSSSTNDVRAFHRSLLYNLATTTNLFDSAYADDRFTHYLIGDKGNSLLPWLLTPYRALPGRGQTIEESVFNRKFRAGRCVVENAFGILKRVFRELKTPTELHVTMVPDLIIACCPLHNHLLGQKPDEVQRLLEMIECEGAVVDNLEKPDFQIVLPGPANMDFARGEEKRAALGLYLTRFHNPP